MNWHFTKGNIQIANKCFKRWASQVALVVKNTPADEGGIKDTGSIPGSGRSPGIGNGYPLQYSCLENTMDGGVWQAMVHGISKSDTTEVT